MSAMRSSSVRKTFPGMRVGVEHAIDEDLLEVGPEQFVAQRVAVQLDPTNSRQRRDLDTPRTNSMVSTRDVV
jgi:hypothetical protein